jgi:hypothetical protein
VFLEELNPDGSHKKYRGLGVPRIDWRVIGGMLEHYLVNLCAKNWETNQFACMPKRGVADAWIKILTDYKKYKNIIGVDLAKFFDTVNLRFTDSTVRRVGVSTKIADLLDGINHSRAKVSKEQHDLEIERLEKLAAEKLKYRNVGLAERYLSHSVAEEYRKNNPKKNPKNASLPQGFNTSPLLACLVLNYTSIFDLLKVVNKVEVVHYVDDAVLMSDGNAQQSLQNYRDYLRGGATGIVVSLKKTEYIKVDGKWQMPLKFLGCEFDGTKFSAHRKIRSR